jgi:cytochrome P450
VTSEPTRPVPPPECPAHTGRIPLHGPDFAADPGRVYDRLRQYGPTAPVELAPGVSATLVTGYDAALEVLRDPGTFPKDPRRWQQTVPADCPVLPMMMFRPNCLFTDGATHARLRQAITDSLSHVDTVMLRGYTERSANTLIDEFAAVGEADLLTQYARVLPLLVLNQLCGSPPEIGDRMLAGMAGIFDGVNAEQANAELSQALVELVALKRRQPGADVTSWLMAHPAQLTDEEMVDQLVVFMGAASEPQQNLIANTVRLLLSDDRFAGDLSGGNLPVEDALDEVLWTDPPMANYGTTYPVHDIDIGGVRVPADQPVVISFAAANTDPNVGSDQRTGNRAHLAWSAGPHRCPAKGPARLIASVAIETLLDRLPDIQLTVPPDTLEWRPGPFHRALQTLPVVFPPIPQPARESGDS